MSQGWKRIGSSFRALKNEYINSDILENVVEVQEQCQVYILY